MRKNAPLKGQANPNISLKSIINFDFNQDIFNKRKSSEIYNCFSKQVSRK